jgi:hypothetical protein
VWIDSSGDDCIHTFIHTDIIEMLTASIISVSPDNGGRKHL